MADTAAMRMVARGLLATLLLLPEAARAQSQPGPFPPTPMPATPMPTTPMPTTPSQLLAGKPGDVDALLSSLKAAPNEQMAGAIEERIKQRWFQAGSPAATLLMSRGLRNLSTNSGDEALGDFDAVLALEPNLQAAFTMRARAKFLVGDYPGALRDTEAALQREPRNFVALQGLSQIAEATGDLKGALLAWQKVLEIDPQTPDGSKRLRELNRKVNGEST